MSSAREQVPANGDLPVFAAKDVSALVVDDLRSVESGCVEDVTPCIANYVLCDVVISHIKRKKTIQAKKRNGLFCDRNMPRLLGVIEI